MENELKTVGGGQRRLLPSLSDSNVLVLDGDKFKVRNNGYKTRKGGCGFGLSKKGVMYTLNTIDQHIVAILGERNSEAMQGTL